jgi:hypothetical protein
MLSEPLIRSSTNMWKRLRTREIKDWISDLRTEPRNANAQKN